MYKQWRPNIFFKFEVILNVLVNSYRIIWIPMLCVYQHYTYLNSFSAGTDIRRQILTSKDAPRAERVKWTVHAVSSVTLSIGPCAADGARFFFGRSSSQWRISQGYRSVFHPHPRIPSKNEKECHPPPPQQKLKLKK